MAGHCSSRITWLFQITIIPIAVATGERVSLRALSGAVIALLGICLLFLANYVFGQLCFWPTKVLSGSTTAHCDAHLSTEAEPLQQKRGIWFCPLFEQSEVERFIDFGLIDSQSEVT